MDAFDEDLIFQWYEILEGQLLDILKNIPMAPQNLNNFSPRLASLIVDSSGLMDSILRQTSADPSIVDGKAKQRSDLNIVDYANLYTAKFELSTLKSILLVSPARYISPFAGWASLASGGSYQPLPWWRTYTNLKHDIIANIKEARLEVAVESLCALHQVLATLPQLGKAVLRNGWVPGNKPRPPKIVVEMLEGKSLNFTLLIETKLFAVAKGPDKLPEKIEDFSPTRFFGSERLIDFFGRE